MYPSYTNQSIDLQSKSIDWFLYKEKIGRESVKIIHKITPLCNPSKIIMKASM